MTSAACLHKRVRFWTAALGYVDKPPPSGYSSWEAWLSAFDVPEEEWNDGAYIEDPEGALPGISFLRVPGAKITKNRVHVDLHVSGGRSADAEQRNQLIEDTVNRLVALGASVLDRYKVGGRLDHVVLADPEGNELCVV